MVYVGAALTVAGTWLVSYKREGEAKWRKIDLLFPLGAAMLASVSQNIRKMGLLTTDEPLVAVDGQHGDIVCLFARLAVDVRKNRRR